MNEYQEKLLLSTEEAETIYYNFLKATAQSTFQHNMFACIFLVALSSSMQAEASALFIKWCPLEEHLTQVERSSIPGVQSLGLLTSSVIVLVLSSQTGFEQSFLDNDLESLDIGALFRFQSAVAISLAITSVLQLVHTLTLFEPISDSERQNYAILKRNNQKHLVMLKLEEIMQNGFSKHSLVPYESLEMMIQFKKPHLKSFIKNVCLQVPFDICFGILIGTSGGQLYLAFDYLTAPDSETFILAKRVNLAIGLVCFEFTSVFIAWLFYYKVVIQF